MSSVRLLLLVLVLAASIAATVRPSSAASQAARGAGAKKSSPAASKAPLRPMVLPFIDDDYTKALAQARASWKPIFIEAWAPW